APLPPRRGRRRAAAWLTRRRAVRVAPRGGDLDQAARAVAPRDRRRVAASREPPPEVASVLRQALEEEEVPPVVADAQEAAREPDALEAVLLEHPLRRDVADDRRLLDAVQGQVAARLGDPLDSG